MNKSHPIDNFIYEFIFYKIQTTSKVYNCSLFRYKTKQNNLHYNVYLNLSLYKGINKNIILY